MTPDQPAIVSLNPKIERAVLQGVLEQASTSRRDPADAMWGAATALLRLRAFMVEHDLVLQTRPDEQRGRE